MCVHCSNRTSSFEILNCLRDICCLSSLLFHFYAVAAFNLFFVVVLTTRLHGPFFHFNSGIVYCSGALLHNENSDSLLAFFYRRQLRATYKLEYAPEETHRKGNSKQKKKNQSLVSQVNSGYF